MAYEYTRENTLREDVCFLCTKITEKDDDGVVHDKGINKKEVFCRVGSVYEKEFYDAYQAGIKAQYKIVVNVADYQNEKIVLYEDIEFSVYRKYLIGDFVELYVREDVGTWSQ